MDKDSGKRGQVSRLRIQLPKPYKPPIMPVKLNKLGLEEKEIYRTSDAVKLLRLEPDTFRWRLKKGWYGPNKYQKDGIGRRFTYESN